MPTIRRTFLKRSVAAAVTAASGLKLGLSADNPETTNPIACFEKPLQSLSAAELADLLAEIGFDGIEATVRKGGRIEPEKAADELPGLVSALKKTDLEILVMATSIARVDQPHAEATLRAAAGLGIKIYRLGGLRYDLKKPIRAQLDELRPQLADLAALNRELGLTAVYQNHAGASNVGGPIWDLDYLMKDLDPAEIAIAYDIRHAMVEGSSAWPVSFNLVRPRVQAVYVKDFVFDGAKPKNVPMGEGIVGEAFFQSLKRSNYSGPISIHSPYLRPANKAEALASADALGSDLREVRRLLTAG
ncbi:MAG: sugar phosphate isomerase/epimerase [Verrucomicrobiales bacterium]|jgi:sugar phosphate isomerase/epimerase